MKRFLKLTGVSGDSVLVPVDDIKLVTRNHKGTGRERTEITVQSTHDTNIDVYVQEAPGVIYDKIEAMKNERPNQ